MNEKELKKLVDEYSVKNAQKNETTKWCKENGDIIKQYFKDNKLEEFEGTGIIAKVSYATKNSFDDEKLIEILKENGGKKAVKKKEYVDMELLESLIYNGKLNAKLLEKASISVITPTLKVVKKKEIKND